MSILKIFYDQELMLAKKLFTGVGALFSYSNNPFDNKVFKEADILLCRGSLKITEASLVDTQLRLIANIASNNDNIDLEALEKHNIQLISLPESNATGLAEYCVTVMISLAQQHHLLFENKTLGIIGYNPAAKLLTFAAKFALGMRVLIYDPTTSIDFRKRSAGSFVSLNEVLEQSNVLVFHSPNLSAEKDTLSQLQTSTAVLHCIPHGTVLINLTQTAIFDRNVILSMLASGQFSAIIADAWEAAIPDDMALVKVAYCVTPDITSHTYESIINHEINTYRTIFELFGLPLPKIPSLPEAPISSMTIKCTHKTDDEIMYIVTQALRKTEYITAQFKKICDRNSKHMHEKLGKLHRKYRAERQFSATRLKLIHPSPTIIEKLSVLGFEIQH